jgi:hypothetical protein
MQVGRNLNARVYVIATLALAIVVLGLVGMVAYAKPNPKALSLVYGGQQAADEEGISNGKGLMMQKMFNNIRKLPPAWGLWLNKKSIEISEGFKEKVVNILKSNENTSKLLDEGYNITAIRPIIKLVVQDDGTVVLKAVGAWVTLHKEGGGVVHVLVDLENSTVVKIWGPATCVCKCPCVSK